jgi:rhodanese-related sulfurtransferase
MKRPYLLTLGITVVVLAAGLIFTSVQTNRKYKFKRDAEEIHSELLEAKHFIDPNTAYSLINKGDEKYVFIDIRNPRDYDNFHIESALNIPMQRVLDDEYIQYLKDDRIKVLYSEESIDADQVRLLLTQFGYENLMVLQGGARYWKENMLSRDVFKTRAEYDDEKLKFDPAKFKK